MLKSNFHSHSRFDDGSEELESYIKSALKKGFSTFGFSAHAPITPETYWHMSANDMDEYLKTINALKETYRDSIEIYSGLETDYYSGCIDWRSKDGIDYTLGAVHFIVNEKDATLMPIDGSREEFEDTLKNGYHNDIHSLISAYFGKIREMLHKMPPDIVAHLDVIRKNNAGNYYFSEEDEVYQKEVLKTLNIISLTGTIVEINTGGIPRGYVSEPYPSRWILEKCFHMGIPIMVNSDSHHPDNIDYYYDEVYAQLQEIGYKKQRILHRNVWQDVLL